MIIGVGHLLGSKNSEQCTFEYEPAERRLSRRLQGLYERSCERRKRDRIIIAKSEVVLVGGTRSYTW